MATTPKTLAEGLMAVSTTTMATVPAGKAWVGISIMLYNIDANNYKDVYISIYTNSLNRGVFNLRIDENGGNATIKIAALSENDLIKGNATDGSSITYVIVGGEQ